MQVTANGVSFNCAIDGREGAPWLTFSNSLATNLHMWDRQAAALGADFRILRYDKRGHGASEAPEGPYDFDMLVADAVGLWDALGIASSHFVGLSIGGMTALGLGIHHPDRVGRMVVSNAVAEADPAFRSAWDGRIAAAEADGMGALVDSTVERWCSEPFLAAAPPELGTLKRMVASTSVAGYVGCARALQGLAFESRMAEISAPTLFLAGKEDAATPAATMSRIARLVPGAEYVELSPAGHISNMELPDAYTAALRRFLGAG